MSNVVVYAEWQDRDIKDGAEALFTDQNSAYVTVGYRLGKFMPHITFAQIDGEAPSAISNVLCAEFAGCTVPSQVAPPPATVALPSLAPKQDALVVLTRERVNGVGSFIVTTSLPVQPKTSVITTV